jgi:FKBP-type peptidyl-prolyl cis-trans isomerase FklB
MVCNLRSCQGLCREMDMKARGSMKSLFIGTITVMLFVGTQLFAAEDAILKTDKDKISYSLGVNVGTSFKQESVDIDTDIFQKGFKDALSGSKRLLTDEEMRSIVLAVQKEVMAKQTERMKTLSEKNKKEGEAFLAENKTKEGVKTLPSGLQYKVIKEGTGKMPKPTDTVTTNYRGTLIDGTEFDSSYKRGQPATFPVNGVIPGWTEALQLMKTGSKWQLFVPTNLAYGERGPAAIGPNAVLLFDIELISIKE